MDRQELLFGRTKPDWRVFRAGLAISLVGGIGLFGMIFNFAQPGISMGVYPLPVVLLVAALVALTGMGSMAFLMATKFQSREER